MVSGLWDGVQSEPPAVPPVGSAPSRPLTTPPIPVPVPVLGAMKAPASPLATSPVTVMAPERGGCHACRCQRAPSRSRQARTLRVQAAQLMHTAFCTLVRQGTFMWTDIDEGQASGRISVGRMIMCSPEQDPMGVLAAALHIMRYALTDAYLELNALSRSVRYRLAAILMVAYKLKSDGWWSPRALLSMGLIECFLCPTDVGPWEVDREERERHEQLLHAEEAALVASALPLHALVEDNVHSAAELALARLITGGQIHAPHATLALSTVHFYLASAMQNGERDVLEVLGVDRTTDQLGSALALLGVLAQTMKHAQDQGRADEHVRDVSTIVVQGLEQSLGPVVSAAAQLADNALTASQRLREGAYAESSTRTYPLVADAMVGRLATALHALPWEG